MKRLTMLSGMLLAAGLVAFGAAKASAYDQGVQKRGVVFNIADDRKVEKVGGIYEPEGLDKYVKRKFDRVEAQISVLQTELQAVQSSLRGIEARLEDLAGEITKAE